MQSADQMSAELESPKTERPSVLVVDDDEALGRLIVRSLTRAGFQPAFVNCGYAAIDELTRRSFDVIVSDIEMGGMTGVELLDEVRMHDLDVPVILMTGHPTLDTAVDAISRGVLQYLTKPTPPDVLVASVQRAANLHRLARMKREALKMLGESNAQAGDRAGLEANFERALSTMWMAFQPIVEPVHERVFGYEALMRSTEPSLPHPGAILDAAERLDRLPEVGRRVRTLSAAAFQTVPNDNALLFVNLHTRDLLDEELYDPDAPLTRMARRVVLEITERAAIDDVKDVQTRVEALRRLGYRIAIDDLGAGYAGLSSFVALRPEIVKLDMSLVRNVHQSDVRRRLVAAMTSVAEDMGMQVIAEGIEQLEERDVVHGCGCNLMQGYLFAKPGPPFPEVDGLTMRALRPAGAAAPPGAVAVGSSVDGRYELRRDLGRGAAGVVFEARHQFTGRDVALKVVAPDVPRAKLVEYRARLMREARALASVHHRGVVGILDGGVLRDGTPFIVMERLTGRTLEGLLATRTKLPREEVIGIALQLCDALDAVHRAGVVHRDVKPANILIVRGPGGEERVVLVDFGIAQLEGGGGEKVTGGDALIGTPAYMAPEQLLALAEVDGRADLYALGVTVFECLTGNVPYLGGLTKLVMQVCGPENALSIPSYLDPAIGDVLRRALAKKREERFASGAEMSQAIRSAFPEVSGRTRLIHPSTPPLGVDADPNGVGQRRKARRAPYSTPVRVTLPENIIDGRSEDISEGGILVIAAKLAVSDGPVNVRLAMPMEGRVVSCDARIRWSRCARVDGTDGPHAMGFEFIDPPPALVTSIARYVGLMGG